MTRHVVRLMWNRRRQNLLLMVEILVAFLVVVAVAVAGAHFGYSALQPLGFSYDDVWTLRVQRAGTGPGEGRPATLDRDTMRQIVTELQGRAEIVDVAGAFIGPYGWYSWSSNLALESGANPLVSMNRVDDGFGPVLDIPMLDGRWFSPEDDTAWAGGWEPVIINRRLAEQVFGEVGVVGRAIPERREGGADGARPKRVVGVIGDFRQFGELSVPQPVLFYRRTLDAPADRLELPDVLLLKVRPGTTAAFEEGLLRQLRALAPTWTFGAEPVVAMRESMLRDNIVPLAVVTIVAVALLLMVALGLTGVVWQSVTQRIREFGVRRAQGATAAAVGRQVIGELMVMVSFAVAAGCVLLLQIPLLPLPPGLAVVPRGVFVAGVLVAIAAVYSVTTLCAWYPSRLATRVPPADALRYE